MADEKPKTLQEQSSPTDPPVSQEVKDTAPAVAQPGEKRTIRLTQKSVVVKETEAADSKKLDDIVKKVKMAQQKKTEANPATPDKNSPLLLLKYLICQRPDRKKSRKRSPQKDCRSQKETKEKPVQTAKPVKPKSTVSVSKGATGVSAPHRRHPHPGAAKGGPRRGEEQIVYLKLNELHAFKNHPFGVRDDEEMRAMVSSVKDKGVTQPGYRPALGGRRL